MSRAGEAVDANRLDRVPLSRQRVGLRLVEVHEGGHPQRQRNGRVRARVSLEAKRQLDRRVRIEMDLSIEGLVRVLDLNLVATVVNVCLLRVVRGRVANDEVNRLAIGRLAHARVADLLRASVGAEAAEVVDRRHTAGARLVQTDGIELLGRAAKV